MAQSTGTSYFTSGTIWTSSTSFIIVDIYTLAPGPNGVPTPNLVSQAVWAFPTLSSPDTTVLPTSSMATSSMATSSMTTHSVPTSHTSMSISITHPTAASATSVPTSHATTESSGLGGGVVAGISIATALVGGLLGIVAGLFLARRRKRHRPPPEYVSYSDREKAPASTDRLQLDQFMLEPKLDTTIASDLSSLDLLIREHTETHYHLHPVRLESSQLRQPLSDLGIERGSEPAIARLASLALEPRTRLSAIRYVISKAAFESTVIGGSACVSLLPPLISGMSPIIPLIEDSSIGSREVTELAITRWRQLSAFLLHPNRSQRTPLEPSEDISTQQAQELTVALIRFLQPFISSDREERYEQENNLREVIAECATFGYVILSQPSEYRFRFESNGGLNTIVVCPGLDKLIDEGGRHSKSPLPQIVAPVVESI
ncbi:hypothetical protein E0Z10_g6473 [Xylaria hypoxylon]|uniref:Uncharacterized protein n=1 Tax=Xylaria hypoxylon TaxID=37992 RepID=A0A4Z0YE61_9PEZI|nr:hypothetical protein E0Z10_g6473 [Xylaria hypoxylon]